MYAQVKKRIFIALVFTGLLCPLMYAAPEAAEPNQTSGRSMRTITTRDPQTGRTVTQQVPTDPEALMQRRLGGYQKQLGISDEQWETVKPLLAHLLRLERALDPGYLKRKPQETGEDADGILMELSEAYKLLAETAGHSESTDQQIDQAVQTYQQKRQELQQEIETAQAQLLPLLTSRQRAQLILEGVLE